MLNEREIDEALSKAFKVVNGACYACDTPGRGIWIGESGSSFRLHFVCLRCVARRANQLVRTKGGATARFRLMQIAETKGRAVDGNYEIVYRKKDAEDTEVSYASHPVYNEHESFVFYYRGKIVTLYYPETGAIVHAENEYSTKPRTRTLRTVNENAIALWKLRSIAPPKPIND